MFNQFLKHAQRVIAMDSTSSYGNEELVQYLQVLMQNRGIKTDTQQVKHSLEGVSKRQFNLIGVLGDALVDRKLKKGLLLVTHLDTASSGDPRRWNECSNDPFCGSVIRDQIYGLGASDAKLDFLCKLFALLQFKERKLKMPVYLVGTCGAEMGHLGSRFLIESHYLNPRYICVGKPTGLKMVTRHKAVSVFKVTVGYHVVERGARGFNRRVNLSAFGRTCDSSDPSKGKNAIELLFEFIHKGLDTGFDFKFTRMTGGQYVHQVPDQANIEFYLTSHQLEDFKRFFKEFTEQKKDTESLQVEWGGLGDVGIRFLPEPFIRCMKDLFDLKNEWAAEFHALKDPVFRPEHTTISLARLQQNTLNTELLFEVRSVPQISHQDLLDKMREKFVKVTQKYPSMNMDLATEYVFPGLQYPEVQPKGHPQAGGELLKKCFEAMEAVDLKPRTASSSLHSEAGLFYQKGFDTVVWGPGADMGSGHAPNEACSTAELERAINFYIKLIEKICL